MGVCKLTKLPCGCKIKEYTGGTTARIGCGVHSGFVQYRCRVCNLELPSKNSLKKHRWTHAIK